MAIAPLVGVMKHRVFFALVASTALIALCPRASSAAGPSAAGGRTVFALQPIAALHWDARSLLRVQPLLVTPQRGTQPSFRFGPRALPRALDPRLAAWLSSDAWLNRRLSIHLATPATTTARTETERLPKLDVNYLSPTLLRFADEATDVAVSISPGGPCTGACLKVTGSFQ